MAGAEFNNSTVAVGNSCRERLDYFSSFEKNFILVTDVILSSLICTMGLVLNTLSIIVLRRDVRRSSMSVLLLALSAFDLTFLLLSGPYYVVYMGLGAVVRNADGISLHTQLSASPGVQRLLPAMWFLGNVARSGRNWVIVIVALDRYMVVQNPFLSTQRSNPKRARAYCLCVCCCAVVYNLPLLLEHRTLPHQCLQVPVLQGKPERLGTLYMRLYKKAMYIIFLSVGPMLWLTVFNILLIRSLMLARRIRAAITRETSRRTEETKMLVVIIAVFVLTETPGSVWHLLMGTWLDRQTWFNSYLYSVGSLLTLFNSAINFFIYCVWSAKFRRNMLYLMRRRKRPLPRVIRFDSDSDRTRRLMLLAASPDCQHQHQQHQHQHQQSSSPNNNCIRMRFV